MKDSKYAMSVSNPLLKDLKDSTRKLLEFNEINDQNINLLPFCEALEKCFLNGILMSLDMFGTVKEPHPWYWLKDIANHNKSLPYTFLSAIEQSQQCEKIYTSIGHLRLFIRICLNQKCLYTPVEYLVRQTSLGSKLYHPNSILGDDILGEIFLSVLYQSSKMNFKLNVRNCRFVDETWQLPDNVALELVPCKTLGISVCFIKEKAVIVDLKKSSVAAEDNKVEIGDLLDEINNNPVVFSNKGKLSNIMKKSKGQPIYLHVIKFLCKETNEPYGPIVNLIENSGIEYMMKFVMNFKSNKNPPNAINTSTKSLPQSSSGYDLIYCGFIFVGDRGDVKQIEKAIWKLLQSKELKKCPVKFECLELGIKVSNDQDNTVMCNQSYMEISSCGRSANIPDYFAFIAGETNCNLAKKFYAHVFHHRNEEEMKIILQSMSQGFQRTHFAV